MIKSNFTYRLPNRHLNRSTNLGLTDLNESWGAESKTVVGMIYRMRRTQNNGA
jgi:hypothetical protein